MDYKKIGEKLRNLRVKKGYTPTQFAAIIGVSNSSVSYYESGKRRPSEEVKKKIAQAFEMDVKELFE